MVKLPGAVVFGTRAIQVLQADSQRHSLDPAGEDCRRCSILICPLQTYSSQNILLIYFDLLSDYFRTHNMGASKSFISPTYEVTFSTIIANKHSLPLKHIWSIVKNPRGIRRWAVCKNPEEKKEVRLHCQGPSVPWYEGWGLGGISPRSGCHLHKYGPTSSGRVKSALPRRRRWI